MMRDHKGEKAWDMNDMETVLSVCRVYVSVLSTCNSAQHAEYSLEILEQMSVTVGSTDPDMLWSVFSSFLVRDYFF